MNTQTLPQKFIFHDQEVDFEIQGDKVMVNATQMAKIFDKRIDHFLKSDHASAFKNLLEFTPFGGNSAPLKPEEVIITKGQGGTFMHRILALKFAAWLDPAFELWVYTTIDQVLFGKYRDIEDSLKESARRRHRIETLKEELRTSNQFQQLEILLLEEKQAAYRRNQSNKAQLSLFQELLPENID